MIIAGEHGGVNKVLRSTWLRSSIDECAFYARFMLVLCNPYAHTNCDTFFLRARGYLKKTLFVTLTKIFQRRNNNTREISIAGVYRRAIPFL